MPNSKTHFLVGAVIGVGVYCLAKKAQDQPIELSGILGMGLVGGVAGLLPDLIEPATSPHHRELAHSFAALIVIGAGINNLNDRQDMEIAQKELWTTLALGYASHLLLDAGTPAGLPAI